jgi:hypothetical protein
MQELVAFRTVPVDPGENMGNAVGVSIVIDNRATSLKGFRLIVNYGFGNELLNVEPGKMVSSSSVNFLGIIPGDHGGVELGVVALGVDRPFRQSGEVARLYVCAKDGAPVDVYVEKIDLRNVNNRKEELDGINGRTPFIPSVSALHQNHPNPFNPATTITYDVAVGGNVTIEIFDVSGHRVRTLVNAHRNAGRFEATWDGKDDFGSSVHSGVYFYRMKASGFASSAKKMILLK